MRIDAKRVAVDLEVLKALAEPLRWHIVALLAGGEMCVCHLVDELGIRQPLVSHHLKVLRAAGVVEMERQGYWNWYRLRPDALEALAHTIAGLADSGAAAAGVRRPACAPPASRRRRTR